eukprot:9316242-Pyramimonas_sp.AAC.1
MLRRSSAEGSSNRQGGVWRLGVRVYQRPHAGEFVPDNAFICKGVGIPALYFETSSVKPVHGSPNCFPKHSHLYISPRPSLEWPAPDESS